MAVSLSDVLLERLGRDAKPQDAWPELVLAALEGETAVDALLADAKPAGKSAPTPAKAEVAAPKSPKPAYLHSSTVEGPGVSHHPYELAPFAGELDCWLETVESWIAASRGNASMTSDGPA